MKGFITPEEIAELKKAVKDPLFKWADPNKKGEIVFRPINAGLANQIMLAVRAAEESGRVIPISDLNEKIFDSCVLWPTFTIEEKLMLPVGIIPSVVKSIQEKSGFVDVDIYNRALGPDTVTTTIKDFDYWGDVSDQEVETLKGKTSFALFRVRIGRWVFVIRPMTRTDIQIASQAQDDQLALAKCITMWPNQVEWENVPSGVVELLGRKANEISGWDPEAEVSEI